MTNFYIFVSDVPFTATDLNITINQSDVWSSFNASYPNPGTTVSPQRTGRYVRVQLQANPGELNLAEVVINGTSITLKSTSTSNLLKKEISQNFNSIKLYPNPANSIVNINLEMPEEDYVILAVYDINGKEVIRLKEGLLNEGKHKIIWDTKESNKKKIRSGLYIIRLLSTKHIINKTLIIQ